MRTHVATRWHYILINVGPQNSQCQDSKMDKVGHFIANLTYSNSNLYRSSLSISDCWDSEFWGPTNKMTVTKPVSLPALELDEDGGCLPETSLMTTNLGPVLQGQGAPTLFELCSE